MSEVATKIASASLLLAVAVTSACVFPADEPTGVELSWRFVEVNEIDGADTNRIRTCDGAEVDEVVFEITDSDDASRSDEFVFDCETGFQTAEQFQTQASDVFIPLRSGGYEVVVTARLDDGQTEVLLEDTFDVLSRALTVESLDLARATVDWPLAIVGAQSCQSLSLSLFYADPEQQLADGAGAGTGGEDGEGTGGDTDGGDEPMHNVLYRETLRSDRGVSLAGEPVECSAELDGVHLVPGVDPGQYRLLVQVDETSCARSVDIEPDAMAVIDLANLSCDG